MREIFPSEDQLGSMINESENTFYAKDMIYFDNKGRYELVDNVPSQLQYKSRYLGPLCWLSVTNAMYYFYHVEPYVSLYHHISIGAWSAISLYGLLKSLNSHK